MQLINYKNNFKIFLIFKLLLTYHMFELYNLMIIFITYNVITPHSYHNIVYYVPCTFTSL